MHRAERECEERTANAAENKGVYTMKKFFGYFVSGLFILILSTGLTFADSAKYASIISYDWKITTDSSIQLTNRDLDISEWDDINIGVSWERQGYFAASGELIIANQFELPGGAYDYSGKKFSIVMNLQCNVSEVYLNGKKIAGKLVFDNASPNRLEIPAGEFYPDAQNLLALRIDTVQWTGGACDNEVGISHPVFGAPESVKAAANAGDCLFETSRDMVINIRHSLNKASALKIRSISDFHEQIETINIRPGQPDGTIEVKLDGGLYRPGFYHIIVSTEAPFYAQDDIWIAVEPERISCGNSEIPGHKDWWDNTVNELNAILPKTKLTKLPVEDERKKDVYELQFASFENVTIYGYLFVPKKEGKFPAILHLPGYSQSYDKFSFLENEEEVIELGLCIRGHGRSTETVNPGFDVPGFVAHNICDYNKYVYRGAYMDCLRAVDILRTLPRVDDTRIAVFGISQGGGLSLATAALAGDKVDICVALSPFLTDLEHHDDVREVFQIEKRIAAKAYHCGMEAIDTSLNYIDTKNMAAWITASVFYGAGLFDDDCPPHVGFSTFNKIRSEKTFKLYPAFGHLLFPGWADGREFIKDRFKF